MCEVSHQSYLDVGVIGDASQNLGALKGSFWVGATVVQIPETDGSEPILSLSNL